MQRNLLKKHADKLRRDLCILYAKLTLCCAGERVLACGTNAFSPRCSWRPVEAIDVVSEWFSGVAR